MTLNQPNLLFIFADQMRGMDLRCAGNKQIQTPNFDRLAQEGLRLNRCYANIPVCCPNRATLLTGTYATTHQVFGNDLPLPPRIPSLGTVAKAAGYATGYIGKWHLDGVPRTGFTPPGPRRQGFDYWAAYNCSHDYFNTKYYRDSPEVIEVQRYEPEVQTDLTLEFLEANRKSPFCLVVSWGPPHDPYPKVPEKYRSMYDPGQLQLRPNVQPNADNPLARGLECRRTTADYYAAITALDDQFGRILQKLDELNLSENTIVVFSSDHGDMLWSHGWLKKQSPYEESISIPFLIRWPGKIQPGTEDNFLMGTVDTLPTLLGLMGIKQTGCFEGRDYSGKFLGLKDGSLADSVYLANYISGDEGRRQNVPEWRGIRTQRHTYVEKTGRSPWLLFDNDKDPFQMENIVDSVSPELLKDLKEKLGQWLSQTKDAFASGKELVINSGLRELWNEREKHLHGKNAELI